MVAYTRSCETLVYNQVDDISGLMYTEKLIIMQMVW